MLAFLYSRKNYGHPEIHMERQVMPRVLPGASGPTDWNEALDIISFGSPEQVFISSPSSFHQLWGKSMSCLNLQVVVYGFFVFISVEREPRWIIVHRKLSVIMYGSYGISITSIFSNVPIVFCGNFKLSYYCVSIILKRKPCS